MGEETVGADNVGLMFFHGSPDAPEVDIIAGGAPIFDDVEYGGDFPHITFGDIVDSQIPLFDHLGIDKFHAVVGSSLGGMMVLNFATRYPESVHRVIPVACGLGRNQNSPLPADDKSGKGAFFGAVSVLGTWLSST